MFANCPRWCSTRFPAAQLFPAQPVQLGGFGEGGGQGSHVVVAEYDQVVRSPSTTMRLRRLSRCGIRAAAEPGRLYKIQRVPAGSLRLPVLQRAAPPE